MVCTMDWAWALCADRRNAGLSPSRALTNQYTTSRRDSVYLGSIPPGQGLQETILSLLRAAGPSPREAEPDPQLPRAGTRRVPGAVTACPGPELVCTHWPRAQEATCPKQEGATGECAMGEDVGNELPSTGTVKEPLKSQERSEAVNVQKKPLQFLGNWIRAQTEVTLLLILLVLLLLALAVTVVVLSGGRQTNIPAVPGSPRLLACPAGWVGYHGMCYFLSKDHRSWDEAQAQCSELGASLAVLRDEEMEFLFQLSQKVDCWLGLRRRGQQLQWEDGSSFNSSVPVLGNAECVFLAENKLRRIFCSNPMPYLCSRPQTRL